MSAKLNHDLSISERNLRKAILAAKNNQVATSDLAEIFNATFLDDILPHNTRVIGAGTLGNTYLFKFITIDKSDNTQVYKLHTFTTWQNVTGSKYLSVYDGPEFIITNSTTNCTRSIQSPVANTIYETCTLKDYHDSRLTKWKKDSLTKETPISIEKSDKFSYIDISFTNGIKPCRLTLSMLQWRRTSPSEILVIILKKRTAINNPLQNSELQKLKKLNRVKFA